MKQKDRPWWIKERLNPQLGTFYVGCGQLAKTVARDMESPIYGGAIMHRYPDWKSYDKRLRELRKNGSRVHLR